MHYLPTILIRNCLMLRNGLVLQHPVKSLMCRKKQFLTHFVTCSPESCPTVRRNVTWSVCITAWLLILETRAKFAISQLIKIILGSNIPQIWSCMVTIWIVLWRKLWRYLLQSARVSFWKVFANRVLSIKLVRSNQHQGRHCTHKQGNLWAAVARVGEEWDCVCVRWNATLKHKPTPTSLLLVNRSFFLNFLRNMK